MRKVAKIIRDGNVSILGSAGNYQGYLVSVVKRGVGEVVDRVTWVDFDDVGEDLIYASYEYLYRFIINQSLISKKDLELLLKKNDLTGQDDIRKVIGTEIEKYLVKWGKNEGGLLVVDKEEEDLLEFKRGDKMINFVDGVFGYRIGERIPQEVWELIKESSSFHDGKEEDQEVAEDQGFYNQTERMLKGWYYTPKAITILLNSGYRVSYKGKEISKEENLENVFAEVKELEMREEQRRLEANKIRQDLDKEFGFFFRRSEVMSKEEVEQEGLETEKNQILLPCIDIEGFDIYGGGMFLLIKNDFLYFIKNNGMDGDNWALNNYKTGGAGAIASKLPLTEEVKAWLDKVRKFKG